MSLFNRRKLVLLCGLIIYICVGMIYSWSNFVDPMEKTSGFSRNSTSMTFTVSMIVFGLACFLGGWMVKKFTARITIQAGAFMMLLGLVLSSFAGHASMLHLTYGVLATLGFGTTYVANMSAVQRWFPDKPGMVSGILLAGYGFGGTIWGTIGMSIVTATDWINAFRVIGGAIGIIVLLLSLVVKEPGAKNSLEIEELKRSCITDSKKNVNPEIVALETDLNGMLGRKSFWLYFAWASLVSSLWLGTVSKAAVFALDIGAAVTTATLTAGLITCGNGLGRLLGGYLHDYLKQKKVLYVITSILVAASILFYIALTARLVSVLMVSSIVMGVGYGAQASTNPVFIRRFYGDTNYSENFGIVNFNSIIGAIFGTMLGNTLASSFSGYNVMMIYFIVIAVLAFLSQMLIKKP